MKRRVAIILVIGGLVAATLFWLERDGLPGQTDPSGGATYVGRAVCASCHAAEERLWTGSHHDLAMQEATAETVLGDFDTRFTHGDVTSTFYRRDGKFFVRTEGPEGTLIDYPIAYTFGAIPLQQYLIPFPGGRFQALNLAWDSRPREAGGQRWFNLYPEADPEPEDPLHWTRPSQTWNNHCAECHSTHLVKGFDLGSRTYRTTWSEIDVSCEACHGPGSTHVEVSRRKSVPPDKSEKDWALVAALTDRGRAWAFAPGAKTASRREPRSGDVEIETCAHCHSRRAMIESEQVAGQPLLDTDRVSLLREGLYYPDGQILDEVYVYGSFVQSKMYREGVTCSDCHDPHSLSLRAEGNALCTRCHLAGRYDRRSHHFHEPGSPGAQCVECHLPATTYMVVDPRRDHSLRIPRPDLSVRIGVPNACNRCHSDRSAEWAAAAVGKWYGPGEDGRGDFAEAIQGGRIGDPAALDQLIEIASDPARAGIVRATALSLFAGYPAGKTEEALREGLRNSSPLLRLGALQGLEAQPSRSTLDLAYPLVSDPVRAIRIEAGRLLAPLPDERLTLEQSRAIARSMQEYEQAQRVNDDHPSAWVNLGNLYGVRGKLQAAEAAYRQALELDPRYLPASLNLADFFRARSRDDLAERVLLEALERLPSAPELLHSMGLLKIRRKQPVEALEWLRKAAASRPGNARFAYVYGVALASGGESEKALQVLRESLEQHPFDPDLLTALATYSRDSGEIASAIRYAERLLEILPEDSNLQQLLSQLRKGR